MVKHEFKITSSPRETHIFIDGKEIKGVRCFKVEQELWQDIPRITLEILAKSVEINGVSVVNGLKDEKPTP